MTLTLISMRSFGSLAHVLRDAADLTARKVRNFLIVRQNRRAVMTLAHFDDRMLHDIGLSRSGVAGALEASFAADPSAILARTPSTQRVGGGVRSDAPPLTLRMVQGFAQGIA